MKVTNTEKTKLGIFVILTGAVLIIALYFIGKKQNLFGNTFKVTAVFSNVNGLKLGNNVRFSGINVGTVRNILMVDDSTICVDMIIDEEIRRHMKRSAVAVGSKRLCWNVRHSYSNCIISVLLVARATLWSSKRQ